MADKFAPATGLAHFNCTRLSGQAALKPVLKQVTESTACCNNGPAEHNMTIMHTCHTVRMVRPVVASHLPGFSACGRAGPAVQAKVPLRFVWQTVVCRSWAGCSVCMLRAAESPYHSTCRVAHFGPLSWLSPKSKRNMADRSFGRGFRSPKIFALRAGRLAQVQSAPVGIRSHNSHQPQLPVPPHAPASASLTYMPVASGSSQITCNGQSSKVGPVREPAATTRPWAHPHTPFNR